MIFWPTGIEWTLHQKDEFDENLRVSHKKKRRKEKKTPPVITKRH